MKTLVADLFEELNTETHNMIDSAREYILLSETDLNRKTSSDKWSILECIAHINLYSDFYLPEFEARIANAKHKAKKLHYTRWLGKYAYESMLPKNGILKPMNTFKKMNPSFSSYTRLELDKFIEQQTLFIDLLKKAEKINITKTKCNITLPLIKFTLGDALKFYVYHNMRHIIQAKNVLNS